MEESFKKKIIDALKMGGFPTELKVGKILDQRDWFNISNYIYFDSDKKISREIDFFCMKFTDANDFRNVEFKAHLLVEVKKSESSPWAFFIQKNKVDQRIDHDRFSSVSYDNINSEIWDRIYKGFPSEACNFSSSSAAEVFKKAEISSIYKAVEGVTKACTHFLNTNEIERRRQKSDDGFRDDLFVPINLQRPCFLNVFIPVIVVDAVLLKVDLDENEELAIEEASYIPYTSYYISDYNVERSIVVNVVTLQYLPKFLEDLEKWIELEIQGIKELRGAKKQ